MFLRLVGSETVPGAFAMPAGGYPSRPAPLLSRWLVRMVVDVDQVGDWKIESHVLACSSTDAVAKARSDFYEGWATPADRARIPLRVLEVLQEAPV